VPSGIASNTVEAVDSTFSPNDYFLGIAQKAITAGRDTRIVLPGRGEVQLYPERNEYVADIADHAAFFCAPASEFRSSPLEGAAPAHPRHMDELLWQAAFHASQGRLVDGITMFDVVQFRRWPNLPHLPKTANTARICALLTRHPTTIMLAHRLLGIRKDEVYQIYSAAYCAGLANIINQNPEALPAAEPLGDRSEARGLFRSLFAKISGL
jgi:hypothetical protein